MAVDNRDPEKLYLQIKSLMDYRKISITEAADLVEEQYQATMNGNPK